MAQKFEHFDQRIADGLIKANDVLTGLPKFLGAKITKVTPGQLSAMLEVRDELITPLGTLHGGVMAALVAAGLLGGDDRVQGQLSVCGSQGFSGRGVDGGLDDQAHGRGSDRGQQRRATGVHRAGHGPHRRAAAEVNKYR
jgi:hypothetical protein